MGSAHESVLPSGLRIRPGQSLPRMSDLDASIDAVEARVLSTRDDRRLVAVLRWVQQSLTDAESASVLGGSAPATMEMLESITSWGLAVSAAIASALAYRTPAQRRTAMALAAEESAMRIVMSVEPARIEAAAAARGVEGDDGISLRRALADLAARVEVADRMLHARTMTAVPI